MVEISSHLPPRQHIPFGKLQASYPLGQSRCWKQEVDFLFAGATFVLSGWCGNAACHLRQVGPCVCTFDASSLGTSPERSTRNTSMPPGPTQASLETYRTGTGGVRVVPRPI